MELTTLKKEIKNYCEDYLKQYYKGTKLKDFYIDMATDCSAELTEKYNIPEEYYDAFDELVSEVLYGC